MRVAVVGGGLSGLVSAYILAKEGVEVVLYEKEDRLGGHAKTTVVNGIDLDLGFMAFNQVTYPNMMELFETLGVDMEASDMSFSVSLDDGNGCEWGSRNGFSSLFAQKKNLLNPHFWNMLWELNKFKDDVLSPVGLGSEFMLPFVNRISHNAKEYVYNKSQLLDCYQMETAGCLVICEDGSQERYNGCIIATHASDALRMIGEQASYEEKRILGAFNYIYSDMFLHHDTKLMPQNRTTWSACNFRGTVDNKACLTYWLNLIQNIDEKGLPFLVTVNPPRTPESTLLKWSTRRPTPSLAASKASLELHTIQGKRNLVFCGAYQGYGLHEDAVKIVTKADLGLGEAYVNGDFSLVDKNKGLLDMLTLRVEKSHEVLDIGCGWGGFAIEIVKQTGCKYTGITLSKEQIQYAESKVKKAGLQFISVQDGKYDEFRRSPGFVREYIFPGGNIPSLSILTSAMAASSRFCVDRVEKIGKHYHQTLRCWRANFLKNQRKILALGYNQEFIRTWEYYFDITAAGFKMETLNDYQEHRLEKKNIKMRFGVVGGGLSGLVSAYVLTKAGVEVVLYEKEDHLGGHVKTTIIDGVDLDLGFMVFNREHRLEKENIKMRVGVVGGGLSGLVSAYVLAKAGVEVVLYEKENQLGGHAKTTIIDGVDLDLGFMVFNRVTYPNMMELFETLGVDMEASDMSFSVSLDDGSGCEWGSRNGFSSLFAQKKNLLNPHFWHMLWELTKFKDDVLSDMFLHHDTKLMPRNKTTWSACNFHGTVDNKVCLTYWLNVIQSIDDKGLPFLVTIDPPRAPESMVLKWSTKSLIPSLAASKASLELHTIQGKRNMVFCGAYQGYGLHEDGVKAGIIAANVMLNKSYEILNNPKQMVPSLIEAGARSFLVKFLQDYIAIGTLILIEEGGTVFTFKGTTTKSSLKVYAKVHNPQFYWKIVTKADLGFAEAYINGDFSLIDKNKGLLDMLTLLIVNRNLESSASRFSKRGWWTPIFLTAGISSAKYFYHHVMRKNTLTQARSNISQHYDLSNEHFSLFLDETMTYSSAIFKSEDEDLKTAQIRKISSLIEKLRVEKNHEVLDIGCGWGGFAIELVKQTGCKYTGITLSEKQIEYAESKVKEAGLQDRITFLLCDYRKLPDIKYDRIISCEAIEHFGHEYYGEFFRCCESALVEDGIFVLQFISVQDGKYDEFRQTPGFIREYIFPGADIPSLNILISAMTSSSRFCVDHVEKIGVHYLQTLRCWRANFLKNKSKILALGFNQEFIRIWEYYFDFCAAGFKTEVLMDYQVVFSRPGNMNATYGDAYKKLISAY
ncbi:hypothetical protein SSX86_020818 [Deinandra increscens subsp. villosa]|uniref:Methyltransferase type 11 domain-containing protein n=1 Tax=Deinandra increscens subsp. villosa TaxID=3103831 RepID=A0AAP0CVM8_9ASTR